MFQTNLIYPTLLDSMNISGSFWNIDIKVWIQKGISTRFIYYDDTAQRMSWVDMAKCQNGSKSAF